MQNQFTGAAVAVWRRAVSNVALLSALALVLSIPMISTPMLAHHGQAEWDNSKTLKLAGTVTAFNWVNPHVSIEWDVKNDNGGTDHWTAELSSPGNIGREGWHHDTLKPGDQVTIYVHPAKNGSKVANVMRVEFGDGRPALGGLGGGQNQN